MASEEMGNAQEETASSPDSVQQALQPVIESINQKLEDATAKLSQDLSSQIDEKVAGLTQPAEDVSALFNDDGKSRSAQHQARRGEDTLSSRPFSIVRLCQAMHPKSPVKHLDAKLEMAIHRQLAEYYAQNGFAQADSSSFLVPFGSQMLPDDIENVSAAGNDRIPKSQFGDIMGMQISKQRLNAISQRAGQGRVGGYQRQALSVFDDTGLGIYTDSDLSGELIELVRAQEVFSRIGAREVTLNPNGTLVFGSQTGAATGYWVGEGGTITTSEPTTGRVAMRAKKCAAMNVIPNELFRFATRDTEAFLRMDLAKVLGLLMDSACLYGVGGTAEPLGITKRTGAAGSVQTKTAGTTATNGDTLEPEDLSGMLAAIEDLNHDIDGRGWAWLMRGKMWHNILNSRSTPDSGGATDGSFLFAVNREDIRSGAPASLYGHPVYKSGQVSNTQVKGSGTDLTDILGGIPDDILIGRVGVLEFTLGVEGTVNSTNLFETDQAALRCIEHADMNMRHENSWCWMTDVDLDLPTGVI